MKRSLSTWFKPIWFVKPRQNGSLHLNRRIYRWAGTWDVSVCFWEADITMLIDSRQHIGAACTFKPRQEAFKQEQNSTKSSLVTQEGQCRNRLERKKERGDKGKAINETQRCFDRANQHQAKSSHLSQRWTPQTVLHRKPKSSEELSWIETALNLSTHLPWPRVKCNPLLSSHGNSVTWAVCAFTLPFVEL